MRRVFPYLLFLLIFFSVRFVAFRLCALSKYANKNFYTNNLKFVLADFCAVMSSGDFLTLPAIFRAIVFVDGFLCILNARKKVTGFLAGTFFRAVNTHENWLFCSGGPFEVDVSGNVFVASFLHIFKTDKFINDFIKDKLWNKNIF